MKRIFFLFLLISCASYLRSQSSKSAARSIVADMQKIAGPLNTSFKECIGAGRANEGLRADWQRQLRYIKDQCDFKYIRMHGLLQDDMGVYSEDRSGKPIYNWQYIDELYDFLLSIKIKPFVEFGFMPEALASDKKTIFWWKGNITPPKDYNKWAALIKSLVQHWTERYGEQEVATWYFEVWNEPNLRDLFWSGDQQEYFKLYSVTANAVKAVSRLYRVGGPSTAGSAWIPEFINYCATNKVPVDFASTHTYGVDQGFADATGNRGTILSKNEQSIYGEIITSRKQIHQSLLPKLELHYTEWSSSYTPTDPIHDSYHEAAYILDKIKKTGDAANSMSYWTFTDIFEENGPRATPFHGGFGLINYQDINKPAFYAYQFLNKLNNQQLQNNDTASWACRDDKGNVQILFWDFTNTHPGDSVNDQVYYKRDLPAKSKGKINIAIKNVLPGKYQLKVYKTGYRVNDCYSTYLDLGSPSQLTRQQVTFIKQVNNGEPVVSKMVSIDNTKSFIQSFDLRENDVFLVVLNKL